MELEVRTTRVGRNSWALPLIAQYQKKILPFDKVEFKNLKSDQRFLENLNPKDVVWLCDERGEALGSRPFSKKIQHLRDGGCKKLVFVVGGPFGVSDAIRERANFQMILSPFVLNQEVALTVLFEQIFRAYTIIHNHPYHND